MKFIMFEVWTKWQHIEADSLEDAYRKHDPSARPSENLNLSNWHIVPVVETPREKK